MTADLLADTAARLLAARSRPADRRAAETRGWAPELWSAVADAGLPWISVPEAAGGSGGDVSEAITVLRLTGAHAAPVPLAETGLLGGWLLAGAGLDVPPGPATVAAGDVVVVDGVLHGTATGVAWARHAESIVLLTPDEGCWQVVDVEPAACAVRPRTNLAGEPRDIVIFDGARPAHRAPAAPGVDPVTLAQRGALSRVALIAGALESIRDLTVRYTNEREQFGRPVARFQAVQSHLVEIAQQAAMVRMALDVATSALTDDPRAAAFEVAAAKVLADRAAGSVARAAHQAHGAIGMTQEYPLQDFTRRLWSWRQEYGRRPELLRELGSTVLERGADGLYPLIAGS